MAKRNTAEFLRLMNEANNAIAARAAQPVKNLRGDPVRIQRDAERREKAGGPLRAREHTRSRPVTARHAFGRPQMY
jgi:hypothetical protein